MNISMILSGGSGSRFGSDTPKQYNMLNGKEVISYSIDALKKSRKSDAVIVVCDKAYSGYLSTEYDVVCVEGANSRNGSLRRGLEYIKSNYPDCEKIFITEAARPFLTAEIADTYFDYLDEYDGVITTQHITDSLGKFGQKVTMRDEYYLVQAPEAFRFAPLYEGFDPESKITATSQQLPEGCTVMNYFDFKNNMKITYPEDLVIAEQIMLMRNGEDKSEV